MAGIPSTFLCLIFLSAPVLHTLGFLCHLRSERRRFFSAKRVGRLAEVPAVPHLPV